MQCEIVIVPLLAVAFLASACATPDAGQRSNESYYAVIDSIESHPAGAVRGAASGAGAYSVRVRFDDRTYRTVTQASLGGLRVGDSVRIENDRVRRY